MSISSKVTHVSKSVVAGQLSAADVVGFLNQGYRLDDGQGSEAAFRRLAETGDPETQWVRIRVL